MMMAYCCLSGIARAVVLLAWRLRGLTIAYVITPQQTLCDVRLRAERGVREKTGVGRARCPLRCDFFAKKMAATAHAHGYR